MIITHQEMMCNDIYPLVVSLSNLSGDRRAQGIFSCEREYKMENTAILVDGAFFIKRARSIFGIKSPKELADLLYQHCHKHLSSSKGKTKNHLYRIFFYDCPPLSKKVFHPFLQKQIDLSKSSNSKWRLELHEELKRVRKTALRLGHVDDINVTWAIRYDKIKALCSHKINWNQLTEEDFSMNVKQKGVDMRIGIDITSLALKKQVTQIILISGDSDFVPAAKFARREGIDFILDPMWAPIKPDLYEHIDGLRSTFPNPNKNTPVP